MTTKRKKEREKERKKERIVIRIAVWSINQLFNSWLEEKGQHSLYTLRYIMKQKWRKQSLQMQISPS